MARIDTDPTLHSPTDTIMREVDARRHPAARAYVWRRRAAAVLISAALVAGQAPTAAWAQDAGAGESPAAASTQQAGIEDTAGADASGSEAAPGAEAAHEGADESRSDASADSTDAADASDSAATGAAEQADADGTGAPAPFADAGDQADAAEGAASQAAEDTITVSVKVTGVTEHAEDGSFHTETWLPLAEVEVPATGEITAWEVFSTALDEAGYTYVVEGWYCPFSITSPDGRTLAATSSEPYSYWSFMVNGDYASVGADQYVMQAGDSIELVYVDGSGEALPEGEVDTNPDAEHPDIPSDWNGFANGGGGAVVEDAETPTEGAQEAWKDSLLTDEEREQYASLAASDPLIIDGKIYVVASSAVYETEPPYSATKSPARISVINASTGAIERQVTLSTSLDSVCRPVYADGIIVVPLAGGRLQAVSAATLETLWVLDGIAGAQSISSLTVADGYVYVATADALGADYTATSGTVRRVNLLIGALSGTAENAASGYYWAGGIWLDGYYLVGDDAGMVHVYASDLSGEVSSVMLSSGVRSTLVADGGYVYAVTKEGVLHKLAVDESGAVREVASVSFAASSTSTPTIAAGKAYVGGSSASYTGVLAVIDLETMAVSQSVTGYAASDGSVQALPGDVKSVPLISIQGSGTYAYFTCNNLPGGLYCYRLGDAAASMLYLPAAADQNYSMTSAFAGPDGTLYYINDSGNLFALRAAQETPGEKPGAGEAPGDNAGGSESTASPSGPASTRPAGTQIQASHAPLSTTLASTRDGAKTSGRAEDAAQDDKAERDESTGAEAVASLATTGADVAEAVVERGANPVAVGGVVAGVAGVGVLAAIALWLRRRGGEA